MAGLIETPIDERVRSRGETSQTVGGVLGNVRRKRHFQVDCRNILERTRLNHQETVHQDISTVVVIMTTPFRAGTGPLA